MGDQSDQPFGDDLSFLGDLDRGLDRDTAADGAEEAPSARRPGGPLAYDSEAHIDDRESSERPQARPVRRRRPLLELFPPSPIDIPPSPLNSRPLALPIPAHASVPVAAPQRPARAGPPRLRPVPAGGPPTYEFFYGLNEKPFSLTPDRRFLYHSTAHDRAAHEVLAAIERRDGTIMLTGAAGSGKTTLCRSVSDELDPRTFTSLVVASFVTFEDLLKTVLIDFGVISRADLAGGRLSEASQYELTIALKEFLLSLVPLEAYAVVFVDDAQNLSAQMLEQVRSLSDLEGDKRLIQLVLVGEPGLLTRLERPDVRPLDERKTVRCDLAPLTEDEISGYVVHRLAVSGGGPSRVEFDSEALRRIYDLSGGLPRQVNRICDRVLTLGYEQSASAIDAALVEVAAADLDLIPPEMPSTRTWRLGVAAGGLIVFMLLGAAAAAFVFRTQVLRVVAAWQGIPPLPPPPALRMVQPVDRVAVPGTGAPDSGVPATPRSIR